ncbi:MAG: methionine aminotransferase [Deltaproteobacteria bacterium]|jgi:methionine aminotransferase|nr:methionine aminotransferase [Deltaproteobacteria bacterium]MBW2488715.1 methionine aminotransferase [Deltaproteobacteria bacterium]MBW2518569.1 methionine aminotransferase [Deltaproteobacteria bacterium]
MNFQSKLPDLELTIFAVMTQLAIEHGAINLSQGFPDFDTYPELISLVDKYMRAGHNQYAPMPGVMLLRERIAEKVYAMYGAQYNPATEITVTSGATESIFAAITAVVKKDDEVIIVEPAYDAYAPIVQLSGGIPVYLQLKFPDYHMDWNDFAKAVNSKTKLIILNYPHNPTGAVLSQEDISNLARIVENTQTLIVSDEAYEHIVFDGLRHESIARHPRLARRSFVIFSFGKTYHTTGWKIGYCLAPEHLSSELQKIHQYLTFASNTPIQLAYAEFMQNKELYLDLPGFYQQKRDLFLDLIAESRFRPLPCKGTYYQMLDYSQVSDEPDLVFARRLTIEHGVAAIPPSALYHQKDDHKVLRFCFAKKKETLERAAEKLCRI